MKINEPVFACQKSLFSLEDGWHYMNCAYMAPLLKSVEEAGVKGLLRKRNPQHIGAGDFFHDGARLRELFGRLVNAPASRVAIIPSASYGLAAVARNMVPRPNGNVITVQEEFPSNIYSLHRICQEHRLRLDTISPTNNMAHRALEWNERILNAINADTVLVNISSVHWADGTLFDLEAIGKRAKEVNALFVVDGTQSVGAMDIDVEQCNIDALICAGYKWLLGPYAAGLAYYSEYFDNGHPIEESWLNRQESENFRGLVHYQSDYRPGAARYNMGEFSNFIALPMLIESISQILAWTPAGISRYCHSLLQPLVDFLQSSGYWVEDEDRRAPHMFGFRLPGHLNAESLQQQLLRQKIVVSLRGNAVRVSPHLYNDSDQINLLIDVLKNPVA